MISSVFPNVDDFKKIKRDWNKIEVVENFIDKICKKELNIKEMKDWYKISRKQISNLGGSGLLLKYGGLINVLSIIYPEYEWENYNNSSIFPIGFWYNRENIRYFMDLLKEKYKIHSENDWYEKISFQIIINEGGSTGLNIYGGIVPLLRKAYPDQCWQDIKRSSGYWNNSENIKVFI